MYHEILKLVHLTDPCSIIDSGQGDVGKAHDACSLYVDSYELLAYHSGEHHRQLVRHLPNLAAAAKSVLLQNTEAPGNQSLLETCWDMLRVQNTICWGLLKPCYSG